MPRLFIAVRPPEAVLDAVAALPRPEAPGVRWVSPSQWHVTVRFFGEAPLEPVVEALGGLPARMAGSDPVEAVVGPAVSRLGRHVLCLPVAGLDGLAGAVRDLTAGFGQPPDPRPFAGHLTLARLQRRVACGLAGQRFAARFPVNDVELVRSTLGRGGATHEVVHRAGW
jgi:RNA 2',3'-cyclic 3'-phosphodiesterase